MSGRQDPATAPGPRRAGRGRRSRRTVLGLVATAVLVLAALAAVFVPPVRNAFTDAVGITHCAVATSDAHHVLENPAVATARVAPGEGEFGPSGCILTVALSPTARPADLARLQEQLLDWGGDFTENTAGVTSGSFRVGVWTRTAFDRVDLATGIRLGRCPGTSVVEPNTDGVGLSTAPDGDPLVATLCVAHEVDPARGPVVLTADGDQGRIATRKDTTARLAHDLALLHAALPSAGRNGMDVDWITNSDGSAWSGWVRYRTQAATTRARKALRATGLHARIAVYHYAR